VTVEALDAALATVLKMKGDDSAGSGSGSSAAAGASDVSTTTPSPFATADPVFEMPPTFDIKKVTIARQDESGEEEDEPSDDDDVDFAEALEEAIVGLGFDNDLSSRKALEYLLSSALDGSAPFPDALKSRVARQTGVPASMLDNAMKQAAKPALNAVQAAIKYEIARKKELEEMEEDERKEAEDEEAFIMERLRTMGPCPAGFQWFRIGNGWRCGGGSHFVYDDDPILRRD